MAVSMSRRREQSSKMAYFLDTLVLALHWEGHAKTNLSRSSGISSKGVHSKITRPGNDLSRDLELTGMANTVSVSQKPAEGTSNFSSSQMAVLSLLWFKLSHTFQLDEYRESVGPKRFRMKLT